MTARVSIGTSALTRDLVWCECKRGLSLSGKWLYCPSCGSSIDQDSYHSAVKQAELNGARLYRDTRIVEELIAAEASKKELLQALKALFALVEGEAPSLLRDDHHFDIVTTAIANAEASA